MRAVILALAILACASASDAQGYRLDKPFVASLLPTVAAQFEGNGWIVTLLADGSQAVIGSRRDAVVREFWKEFERQPGGHYDACQQPGRNAFATAEKVYPIVIQTAITTKEDVPASFREFYIGVLWNGVVEFEGDLPDATKEFWRSLGRQLRTYCELRRKAVA